MAIKMNEHDFIIVCIVCIFYVCIICHIVHTLINPRLNFTALSFIFAIGEAGSYPSQLGLVLKILLTLLLI